MGDNTKNLTLVLGGTGKTGRRVVERLEARGAPVRSAGRSTEPPFDWEDEANWAPVVQGVEQAYVTYYPDLAFAGAAERVRSFADLAVKSGVRRLVLLSGRNEPGAESGEQAIRESGAEWTLVRSSFFAQDFSEYFLLDSVLNGEVAFPAGDVAEPIIDVEDIADVVAAALTHDQHVGQLYEVTGPRLLTFAEAVGEIAEATGRDIRYVPISLEEYAAAMTELGLPPDLVAEYTDLFGMILDGRSEYVADGVQRALGRGAPGLHRLRPGRRCRRRLGRERGSERIAMDGLMRVLTVVAAVGAGVSGGALFAFSTFVMRALGRLPGPQGLQAMQSINREAPTPWFMTALFGTALVCVVLAVRAFTRLDEPEAVYLLAGSAVYLAGIVLTIGYHVPRNDALDLVDPTSPGAADAWDRYRGAWTAWNHVRTLTCLGGSVAFILALRVG